VALKSARVHYKDRVLQGFNSGVRVQSYNTLSAWSLEGAFRRGKCKKWGRVWYQLTYIGFTNQGIKKALLGSKGVR